MTAAKRILVGIVGAPHGIRGEVRLKSLTAKSDAIARYGVLLSEDGRRSLRIVSARALKDDMLVVRFDGVTDRTGAEALTNLRLTVDRESLPAPDEDEFYHADLVGLAAETPEGAALGRVTAVHNFGGGDMLEVAPETGDTVLIPFTKALVPVVDIAMARLVIAPAALEGDDERAPGPDRSA